MDDGRRALFGDPGREALVNLVDHRQLAGLRLLPLALPAPQLPLDVGLLAAQVPKARPRRGRPRGSATSVSTTRSPIARRSSSSNCCASSADAQDRPLDEAHDVEGRLVHRLVLAEPDHRRHGDGRVLEGGDHAVLAAHVVGRAEPLAERRAAERPGVAGRIPDAEGHVRAPPEIRSKLSGSSTSGTFASNQPSTPARSIPSGASVACSPWRGAYAAVLFDFGGVLTTPVWDSFAAFCRTEGLDARRDQEALSHGPRGARGSPRAGDRGAERRRVRGHLREAPGPARPRRD